MAIPFDNGSSGTSGTSGCIIYAGSSGTSGTSGIDGIIGSSGTSGTTGTSGTSGVDGTFFGSSGTSGTSGINGSSGQTGSAGTSGTSGVSGTSGTSGLNGVNGTSGVNGINGSSGTSGTSGIAGTSGVSGTSGSSGTSGINGTFGTSGISGTSGVDGTSGLTGTSGTSGTSGIDGTSGTSGIDGTSGTSGNTGVSGTSGTSGTSAGNTPTQFNSIKAPVNMSGFPWYKLNTAAMSYSGSSFNLAPGQGRYTPVTTLLPGEIIKDVAILVTTAVAASTIQLGLYTVATDANGLMYADTLVTTFGSVDSSTTGRKTITNVNYTIPASTNNTYFIGILQLGGATNVSVFGPANTASICYYGALDSSIMSRPMSVSGPTALTTLPTSFTSATWAALSNNTTYAFVGFKS